MKDWTAERLDALPAFTLIGGIEPAGYPKRSLMIFWFKDEDGLFQWIGYPSFSDSDEVLKESVPGSLRVVSVPVEALLSDETVRAAAGGHALGGENAAARIVLSQAVAHVTGEAS